LCGSRSGEALVEPGFRRNPLSFHCRCRDLQRSRGLLDGQPPEELHLDDARLQGIERGELVQRFVERDDVHTGRVRGRGRRSFIECQQRFSAAALSGQLSTGAIDQYLAHQARRDRHKVCAALHRHALDVHKPEVDLVYQRGRLN